MSGRPERGLKQASKGATYKKLPQVSNGLESPTTRQHGRPGLTQRIQNWRLNLAVSRTPSLGDSPSLEAGSDIPTSNISGSRSPLPWLMMLCVSPLDDDGSWESMRSRKLEKELMRWSFPARHNPQSLRKMITENGRMNIDVST